MEKECIIMSEEKKLNEKELNDEEMESVSGGLVENVKVDICKK